MPCLRKGRRACRQRQAKASSSKSKALLSKTSSSPTKPKSQKAVRNQKSRLVQTASRSTTKNELRENKAEKEHAHHPVPPPHRTCEIRTSLVLCHGDRLRECDVVSAWFLEADLAHAVKRSALRLDNL